MADLVDRNTLLLKDITKLYEKKLLSKSSDLENAATEIEEKIKELLDQNAKGNLKAQTSVNPIYYYGIKSRVKGVDSFEEKLVRKNLGFKLISEFDLTCSEDIKKNEQKIYNKIRLFDDLIGVRIVTELKEDCKSVYELIKEIEDKLILDEVVIDKYELHNQPESMNNGLPIYRMKGLYENKYGFELQIKSKIDEAWGDMDHNIFYKDYSITPIRNTVQETMNHVGKLLDKIEYLLLGLRKSNKEYEKNLQQLIDLKEIDSELTELIGKKINVNFDVSRIASFIVFFRGKLNLTKEEKLTEINFKNLSYDVNDPFLNDYIEIRKVCFELQIIESLFFSWATLKKTLKNTKSKYEINLKFFLDLLIEHLSEKIFENESLLDNELGDFINLKDRITKIISLVKSPNVFMSISNHIELINFENNLNSFFEEDPPHHDVQICLELTLLTKELVYIIYYNNKADLIISLTDEFLSRNSNEIDKDVLIDIFFNLKNYFETNKNKGFVKVFNEILNKLR